MPRKTNSLEAVATIGIDIGKNTFHLIGLDKMGAIVLRQKLSRSQIDAVDAGGHCPFLIRSGHYAKTYSARHARGRRPRRSTRRPKALLPPRQTALVEAVHIFHIQVHIQESGHVLLSWVVSTHEGLLLFYRFTQRDDICF
jgi:hypothetical protein